MELGKVCCLICQEAYYPDLYQNLDQGWKVSYLLKNIWCDKLSSVDTTIRSHTNKYEKDFKQESTNT